MSESCTVIVKNQSGRSLSAVMMWHFPTEPPVANLPEGAAFMKATGVPNGGQVSGTASLMWGSPTDYWLGGIVFQGDGETYSLSGVSYEPWKEYEVSDGSTITFIINAYSAGTANQSDVTIQYSGDDGGSAHLINSTTAAVGEVANSLGEAVAHVAEAALE